jgi:dTDP-4-dehydrorhamnose 3,5-epimerase
MIFLPQPLSGVFKIELEKVNDERGFFSRIYCQDEFRIKGLNCHWPQMNISFTKKKGSIRGIHWQKPPYCDAKVVRCIKGRIFDVAVDLRDQSDTYGQWTGVELSETNHSAFYIPEGFGHGFQTLEEDCEVMYFHSKEYVKLAEAGVSWNDPTLGIPWPLPAEDISARDRSHPSFDAVEPLEI